MEIQFFCFPNFDGLIAIFTNSTGSDFRMVEKSQQKLDQTVPENSLIRVHIVCNIHVGYMNQRTLISIVAIKQIIKQRIS